MPRRHASVISFALLLAVFAAGNVCPAGDEPNMRLLDDYGELGRFRFGSSWWNEDHAGPHTTLLLHFGAPKPYRLEDIAQKRLRKRHKAEDVEELLNLLYAKAHTDRAAESDDADLRELSDQMREREEKRLAEYMRQLTGQLVLPPVEEPEVPEDVIHDYSYYRRTYEIGDIPGLRITPDGKFGSALAFDGTGPGLLVLDDDDPVLTTPGWSSKFNMAQMWVKIPAYPEKNACIFSAGGGEGRLMLRPDGHLDFVRQNPFGKPQRGYFKRWSTEESFEKIFELDMTLVSEEPVPVGEWFHVAVWRSETLVTNMHTIHLVVNGEDVGMVIGSPMDRYNPFLGHYGEEDLGDSFRIGNDPTGEHPFTGCIDDLYIPEGRRVIGDTPQRKINPPVAPIPWRDADASRPLDFGRPFFYRSGQQFHLGFENGLQAESFVDQPVTAELTNPLPEKDVPRLFTEGVRGKAITLDPRISRLRIPVDGVLSMDEGSLEFWLQPVNWDNAGRRPRRLPTYTIRMLRFVCETPDGEELVFPINRLPTRDGGEETDFRPGKWNFFCMTWDHPEPPENPRPGSIKSAFRCRLYRNVSGPRENPKERRLPREKTGRWFLPCYAGDLKPKYLEFGVKHPAIAADGREPIILVDEVVAHDYELDPIEVYQASKRVKGRLEPFKAIRLAVGYKYGLDEMNGTLTTLFPQDVEAVTAEVTVLEEDGSVFAGPVESAISHGDEEEGAEGDEDAEDAEDDEAAAGEGTAKFVFPDVTPAPHKPLTFRVQVKNPAGEVVGEDEGVTWAFDPGEWRGNDLGVPTEAPPPWTPVTVEGRTLGTLMTQYELGADGLPAAIVAKGENLLQSPIRLLEDGRPMRATGLSIGESEDVQARWSVAFEGETCTVALEGRIEFDGTTRFELDIDPTTADGTVAPIRFEIPMKPEHATHRLFQQCTAARLVCDGENIPDVYTSRRQLLKRAQRRAKRRNKRRGDKEEPPTDETFRAWDFWTIMDLCSRDRGLYWFADIAAGWGQSDRLPAQEFRREAAEHRMVLHLVAERMAYTHEEPIVFGLIPHPAKPLPADYRYMEKAPSPQDPDIVRTYSAVFVPLPEHPREGGALNMRVYPKHGSWEEAEEARVFMEMMMPNYRPMYLSLAWLSCRDGRYDNWRWRNGSNSKVSLCDSFIEYLCWEMNGWIERDFYNAIYFDECYAWPCDGPNAVRAGMALEMPDGGVQPGMRLWGFRELMKRWYTLFAERGRRPMILSHHSRNWMYPGMVFAASALDGEGFPAVTVHRKRDFMDKIDFSRLEVINNPGLWGCVSFYMPSIWENGFAHRGEGTHPAWTWRIARSGIGLFAHLENGYTYAFEGSGFFGQHERMVTEWGALPAEVEFVPWYRDDTGVATPDTHKETLVSYYKDDGRVLLIITNREKEDRDITLTLDYEKLGLPKQPTFTHVKSHRYERPEGIDPWEVERKNKPDATGDVDAMLRVNDTLAELGGLEDPDVVKAEKKKAHTPHLEGNVLTVPVRGHDFRLISLE